MMSNTGAGVLCTFLVQSTFIIFQGEDALHAILVFLGRIQVILGGGKAFSVTRIIKRYQRWSHKRSKLGGLIKFSGKGRLLESFFGGGGIEYYDLL